MNEHIKQLAIESKLIAPEYNGFDPTRLSIAQQKFAQLIVQECSKIVLNCGIIGSNNERDFIVASREIKQHFGIEE